MAVPDTDSRPLLLYLHGFKSSPSSQKATEMGAYLDANGYLCDFLVPALGTRPLTAANTVRELVRCSGERPVALLGSSLGGYYALCLSAELGCRAVLVNPAVYPYRLLRNYLGWQHNPYTGEDFFLDESHMRELQSLDVGAHPRPENLLVLLQTGDETLDYRQAHRRLAGSPQWIVPGGDHRFRGFVDFLPAALAFLGIPRRD